MEKSIKRLIAKKERQNAAFWAAMEKTLGEAIDPALKAADHLFRDPKKDPPEKVELDPEDQFEIDKEERRDRYVEREHPLGKRSMQYIKDVDRFFKSHPDEPAEDVPWRDAWEVIHWYKYFIHVKLCRALHGMLEDQEEEEEFLDAAEDDGTITTRDSDGSAKVAIIGIERSISAWSILREHFPKDEKNIMSLMGLLAHVRTLADKTFPRAREFHRAGFDDEDAV